MELVLCVGACLRVRVTVCLCVCVSACLCVCVCVVCCLLFFDVCLCNCAFLPVCLYWGLVVVRRLNFDRGAACCRRGLVGGITGMGCRIGNLKRGGVVCGPLSENPFTLPILLEVSLYMCVSMCMF